MSKVSESHHPRPTLSSHTALTNHLLYSKAFVRTHVPLINPPRCMNISPCQPHAAALTHTRVRSFVLLPFAHLYCRCPDDTSLQIRLMIGLGCTAFLITVILLAMDLKFGWTRKKGGGRLKPIVNAIQSLTVLIMFPSKVRSGENEFDALPV